MDYIKNNKISLFLIYINMLFILGLFNSCYRIEGFSFLLLTEVFLIVLMVYLFFHSVLKSKGQRFVAFILLVIILAVIIFLKQQYFYSYSEKVFANISYANNLMYKNQIISFTLVKELFCLATAIILLVSFMLCSKERTNFILLVNLICMVFLWYTGYSDTVKGQIFGFVFISTMTYCFNSYIKAVKKDTRNGLKCDIKKTEIFLLVILNCFMIALFQSLLPGQINGKYSSNTKSFFENKFIKAGIDDDTLGQKLKFNLSTSGYDDSDKKLGGPVDINDEVVLKVNSDKPYYLRGITKDNYNGFSWKKTMVDYEPKLEKTEVYNANNLYGISKNQTLTIYPQKIKTSTIFEPLYTFNCICGKSKIYYNTNDKTFIKENADPAKYSIDFYKTDNKIDILDESNYKQYEALENYQQYDVEEKYKAYLQVPDNVPTEVSDLVQQITTGSVSSAEKAIKIKNYLKQNYKYSLDVSDVPKDKEFVSYFLFDEKKGYCTYFATAATIMCRLAGVPARYVEGFNMENVQDSQGLYLVSNEDAHAWTEIMLMPDKDLWTTIDCVPNAASLIREGDTNLSSLNSKNTKLQEEQITQKNKDNKAKTNVKATKKKLKKQSVNIMPILYCAIIVLIVFTLVKIIIFTVKKSKILKSSSVIPLYCYSVKRLEKVGIKIPNDKSDMEYFSLYDEPGLREKMSYIVELSYKEYYGNKNNGEFNKKDYYIFIEKYIRERENIIKYIIIKYFYK